MGRMSGADAEDLERGGSRLESFAGQIGGMRQPLRNQLRSSPWNGRAADRFRSEWDSVHSPALAEAEEFLRHAGRRLRAEADQQRRASGSGAGGRGAVAVGSGAALLVARLAGRSWGDTWGGDAAFQRWDRQGGGQIGGAHVDGGVSAAFMSARHDGGWSAGMEDGNYAVRAEQDVRLAAAELQGQVDVEAGPLAAGARADAMLGAELGVEGEASVGLSGVNASAGGEAFVGARAGAEGEFDVAGVGAGGSVEGWAGAGVKADATAKVSMDEISIGVSAGAALGVGGAFSGKISIKPKKMLEKLSSWF